MREESVRGECERRVREESEKREYEEIAGGRKIADRLPSLE